MKRKIEIRLGVIQEGAEGSSNKIKFEDILTATEYKAMQKALAQIHDYASNKRLFQILLLNHYDLENFFQNAFEHFLQNSVSWLGIKMEHMEEAFLQANRLLLNYLSTIRSYLDHVQTYITRRYGSDSRQLKQFKKVTSQHYELNFAYRFLYRLRNYAQHCGIPLQTLTFKRDVDRDKNEIRGRFTAPFNPRKLLQEYDAWGKDVKNDLTQMSDDFDLRALRETMIHLLYNVNYNVLKSTHTDDRKAAKYIFEKTQHLWETPGQICLFHDIVFYEDKSGANFQTIDIPVQDITEILSTSYRKSR